MRQAAWQGDGDKRDAPRLYIPVLVAAVIHLGIFTLFQSQNTEPFDAELDVVKVAIISRPAAPIAKPITPPPTPPKDTLIIDAIIPEAEPEPRLEPPPPPPEQVPLKQTPATPPAPDIRPPNGKSQTLQASPVPDGDTLIPDRWRLPDGARIPLGNTQQAPNSNLNALALSIDCLGFDADCAEIRKDVFAEEQLNETDLVWMPSFAHSGLSDSSLYGLSEAEIRERLGIPTAGVNGIFIPFTNIGLDGAWWDRLHGVNKTCKMSAVIGQNGKAELRKVCPELRGGAGSIPLYRTGNEFRRNSVD